MKQLLLHALTCCAMLLPVQQASAQNIWGDLAPKTKFKMIVTKVTATVSDSNSKRPTKVPATMPRFKLKDKIAFTIGAQLQLNGKLKSESFSIPLLSSTPPSNGYSFVEEDLATTYYSATLTKKPRTKPKSLVLYFTRVEKIDIGSGSGFPDEKTYSVIYELRAAK